MRFETLSKLVLAGTLASVVINTLFAIYGDSLPNAIVALASLVAAIMVARSMYLDWAQKLEHSRQLTQQSS